MQKKNCGVQNINYWNKKGERQINKKRWLPTMGKKVGLVP